MISLDNLRPYVVPEKPFLPGWRGKEAVQGYFGKCQFIVTVDHDGHTEASLLRKTGGRNRRPTKKMVREFFQVWNVSPLSREEGRNGMQHFVVYHPKRNKLQ